jgi:hypothetical protein
MVALVELSAGCTAADDMARIQIVREPTSELCASVWAARANGHISELEYFEVRIGAIGTPEAHWRVAARVRGEAPKLAWIEKGRAKEGWDPYWEDHRLLRLEYEATSVLECPTSSIMLRREKHPSWEIHVMVCAH